MRRRAVAAVAAVAMAAVAAIAVLAAACGGSGSAGSSSTTSTAATASTTTSTSTTTTATTTSTSVATTTSAAPRSTTTTSAPEDTTSLPPGAKAGKDDFDGDGTPDPICGTQDFGGGLVLQIPCSIGAPNDPPEGTTLVKDSLFRLPGATDIDLSDISGSLLLSRDQAGTKVVIVTFNTSALFETGSADVSSADTLDGVVRLVNAKWPGSRIQVRGHTDATGSPDANQTLSENRAASVKSYLADHGLQAAEITSIGFGSSRPLAEEKNADGSENTEGERFDRRVEVVLRVPTG